MHTRSKQATRLLSIGFWAGLSPQWPVAKHVVYSSNDPDIRAVRNDVTLRWIDTDASDIIVFRFYRIDCPW